MKTFSLKQGAQAMNENNEMFIIYLFIVSGIIGHWIWGVLVVGLADGNFEFGSYKIIIARIVIGIIAGAVSFTGIYKQISGIDKKLRLIAAFTQGFAVEALTSPLVDAAS